MSKVFICYSHKDKKYFDLINKHLSVNKKDIHIWSDIDIKGGDNWRSEIQKALDSCNLAILILSANFFNSDFIQDVELKQLLENEFEKGTKLLPILLEDYDIEAFSWIEIKQILPSRDKPLETLKKKVLKTKLKEISQRIRELLAPVPDESTTKEDVKSKNYPDAIDINNFPTSNDEFFGREKYFEIIDKAWNDEQVNILSFIAFGGIGKTSLIDNWLKMMKKDHYRGAKNIFMWSFYSQGNDEDRQVSASEFLSKACRFFGVKRKNEKTPYEQGKELANIISKQRVLLILDGLEPLQSSLEDVGEIKDIGLQVLLKRLSRQNKGLVIVTSRIKISSIDNQCEDLEELEDSEGAQILKSFNLNGSENELKGISKDFDGHALSLKLLGSYVKVVLDRDINRINEIEKLTDVKTISSKHATRMLNSYLKYLKDSIELDILKLIGFFDRPISFEVINKFKNEPLIENINNKLININELDWKYALSKLKELHLISNNERILDTHPLVREYFSNYIEKKMQESYISGHTRLYKYYENLPQKRLPDTVEEMEPLFQAIYHACKAKKYREAYTLLIFRLQRKTNDLTDRYYLTYTLGEIQLEQKLYANFFKKPFSKFYDNIEFILRDNILGNLSFGFLCLGKYKKSLEINRARIIEENFIEDDDSLIQSSVNNSQTLVYLGELNNAYIEVSSKINLELKFKDYGRESRLFAQFAYISFLKGEFNIADDFFKKAEHSFIFNHFKFGMSFEYLLSQMGYQYIEYLFYINSDLQKLEKRIHYIVKFEKNDPHSYTLDIGLSYICLGKLKILKKEKYSIVLNIFNKAISYIEKVNDIGYFIESLIIRADAHRIYGEYLKGNEDLKEAYDLIMSTESKKQLFDWYIVAIKLELNNDIEKANTYFLEAKKLLKELDEYFIFKEELKKLEPNFNKVI
ncbi:MAG: toll/interleukin-1 receptor domain-containing protein [Arcobacter sp.]|uniref:toll/interleukin-1 receptor domain-containing protein n=1 Tax=Arcobacter sp. TaxID=1872629 RepID=UPI002A748A2C|nr:toll/interleukin-1 receptor domain-containing protein [Arcobacter sp.]MDY3205526.1 toll/interleukin-1 receptor domain-containing protein [Arcobacter sp.]